MVKKRRRRTIERRSLPPDCRDGVEERVESCECGARCRRAVRRQNGRVVYGVVVLVEYPDNTGTGFQKEQCPHTGCLT